MTRSAELQQAILNVRFKKHEYFDKPSVIMGIKDVYSTTQRILLQRCRSYFIQQFMFFQLFLFFFLILSSRKIKWHLIKSYIQNDAKVTKAKTQNAFLGTALLPQYVFALMVWRDKQCSNTPRNSTTSILYLVWFMLQYEVLIYQSSPVSAWTT